MASIKRDQVKHTWEDTEFPLVCETCLGDNPYVRMTKEPHGKKCQICENPFTVFAWQAGTKGRLKRVEICRSCAQTKNVCQVCIYDLQYGLPVKVRDKVLREAGATASGPQTAMVPQSMANRAWTTAQNARALAQGQRETLVDTSAVAHAQLSQMAQMEPRYERNMAKLCSFFARGECNRGADCPFRHEMPRDRQSAMAAQSTKNRFYGTSDPVANKILGRKRRQEQQQQEQADGGDYEKAKATLYVRLRGDEPFPLLTTEILTDIFYSYGEIVGIRVQPDKGQAFVEYTSPEATALAIASTNNMSTELPEALVGRSLYVAWARASKRGIDGATEGEESNKRAKASGDSGVNGSGASTTVRRVVAPPSSSTTTSPSPAVTNKASIDKTAAKLPTGFKVKVPAALLAARKAVNSSSGAAKSNAPATPYPSANPQRLGTKRKLPPPPASS